ncbi:MAG: hypothetical protein IPM35_21780 [Myxococcales bacterium]|nr:hypothetical protein [Myxococcales bacterium]
MRFSAPSRFAALLISLALAGCGGATIPNTDVEDTDANRKVINFCEEYRRAVEQKKIGRLLQLADPSYYEDGGNTDAADDLDYAGLRAHLEDRFSKTKGIRYEIRYRRVGKGRREIVMVDYTYSASYKIPTDAGDVWRHVVADNRLELVPSGDTFKIVSGM